MGKVEIGNFCCLCRVMKKNRIIFTEMFFIQSYRNIQNLLHRNHKGVGLKQILYIHVRKLVSLQKVFFFNRIRTGYYGNLKFPLFYNEKMEIAINRIVTVYYSTKKY